MNRGAKGRPARLAATACGFAGLFFSSASAKEIAPFRTALDVHWGAGAGSDAFRNDLSRRIADALATGCFAGVTTAPTESMGDGTPLVFDVALSDAVDEVRFDDSIAGTLAPGEPTNELRRVVKFEVTVDAALTVRANGAVVHKKHLVAHVSRRPVYVGEDALATARVEAIDDIVRDLTRSLGCGKATLTRKIRASLDEDESAPAPR